MKKENNLIWVDTELTGLDWSKNKIVEIAVIVTDENLNPVDEGVEFVIYQDDEVLKNMDPWCIENFAKSGLTEKIRNSKTSLREAENKILEYLEKWTEKGKSPICGNSVGQDRKVLFREMPRFENDWASYRTIDVSSIKELNKRWKSELVEELKNIKKENHRAMDDILERIEELKLYKKELWEK